MNRSIFFSIASLAMSSSGYASLFANSPLQSAYQATLNQQPQLAWQELTLALSQHHIESNYWLPIKNELLAQTDCGSRLTSIRMTNNHFRLSLIKRSGLASQGYQFRVATENNHQPQHISLISPEGNVLLSGDLMTRPGYQEIESDELLKRPAQGIFTLVVDESKTSLILAFPNTASWLSLINHSKQTQVQVNLPKHVPSCPRAVASWLWFDKNYNLIDSKIPFTRNLESLPEHTVKAEAKFLSAIVELVEYQKGISIEYIQRLSIPYQ
ncbi:DUF2861 family protein [Vibrio sagamiensis]|uniref:DUF2861 domain-containing protein n=1 Tax=Vibrio sagamiensis NBRC 104589 TaxID=1219064 RepID=A0A511QM31_9VIBR|nr:DUF2861 family protein [Vibrio sagamiensis]PNQ62001.1 DUF2861 domain-containing protein [Vibrio agarivorans]GEM77572.1 hypothetical protein VSA01S_36840 [Vibrio sagamiensis NBRC 104589]